MLVCPNLRVVPLALLGTLLHSTPQQVRSFSSLLLRPVSSKLLQRPSTGARLFMSAGGAVDGGRVVPAQDWEELRAWSSATVTGAALDEDRTLRALGRGGAHVANTLRLFDSAADEDEAAQQGGAKPRITFYRDNAGWCPYCEKTVLLVEEKRIPINIETVPMRSYGDKPPAFLRRVPNGLLPAISIEAHDGRSETVTESQVIMELLDKWHPEEDGYKPMLPREGSQDQRRYEMLARLERELFSWWCTFLFRPEGGPGRGGFNLGTIFNKDKNTNSAGEMSASFQGFVDCLTKVDKELQATKGPWFLDTHDYPTMIDFIYVSHIERMLASCAYWKGFLIRGTGQFPGLDAWFDAFDQRDSYLAFKSDFYTNVMDIPPQYGPGYTGGNRDLQPGYADDVEGKGDSWKLPLSHDEPLQPLFRGLPLPTCVLEASGLRRTTRQQENDYGSDEHAMARACRHMAGWKLASNGPAVSKFAARGGSKGANNVRKTFAAPLADPYADPDKAALPAVESVLRMTCAALLEDDSGGADGVTHEQVLVDRGYRAEIVAVMQQQQGGSKKADVTASLAYLRDRVGVPRDLPLAAARHLRAHLNWAIDTVESA